METEYQIEPLTRAEVHDLKILLVEPDPTVLRTVKSAIDSLEAAAVTIVEDHLEALSLLKTGDYTVLLFSTSVTSADAIEFLVAAITACPDIVALPTSSHPDVDLVFELLMLGARAYITFPISSNSLNRVLAIAIRTESIPEAISTKNDKFKTISNMLINCVDEIANALILARDKGEEPKELPRLMAKFREAAEMARAFTSGTEQQLLETLQEVAIQRASRKRPIDQLQERVEAIRKIRSSLG